MSTFRELQDRLKKAQRRRQIFNHLIEYIDENFRSTSAGPAKKKMLLDSDRTEIPEEDFESLISEIMIPTVDALDTIIDGVMGTTLTPAEPAEEVAAEPAAEPTPKKKKKSRKSEAGESK